MTALRVVIVEDHPVFREGLRLLLGSVAGVEVVGEAATAEEATTAIADLQPAVVLMDLHLPDGNGIDVTRLVTTEHPEVAVLVLTMFEDDESVFAAMRAGARGYLLKEAEQEDIERAIRGVANGEVIFGPAVADRVLRFFLHGGRPGSRAFPQLTDRELEVLDLVAQGLTNAEITRQLVVSPKTVRNHLTNIFSKLQVGDRSAAIVRAREAGLGERPEAVR